MEIVANVSIVVILSLEANIIDRFSFHRESIVNKIKSILSSFLFFFFRKRSIDEIYLSKKVNYFFFFFFFSFEWIFNGSGRLKGKNLKNNFYR